MFCISSFSFFLFFLFCYYSLIDFCLATTTTMSSSRFLFLLLCWSIDHTSWLIWSRFVLLLLIDFCLETSTATSSLVIDHHHFAYFAPIFQCSLIDCSIDHHHLPILPQFFHWCLTKCSVDVIICLFCLNFLLLDWLLNRSLSIADPNWILLVDR